MLPVITLLVKHYSVMFRCTIVNLYDLQTRDICDAGHVVFNFVLITQIFEFTCRLSMYINPL